MAIEKVYDLVSRGKAKLTPAAVTEALEAGFGAEEILNKMIAAMDVVGEKFKNGEIFVPEMLIAADAYTPDAASAAKKAKELVA